MTTPDAGRDRPTPDGSAGARETPCRRAFPTTSSRAATRP